MEDIKYGRFERKLNGEIKFIQSTQECFDGKKFDKFHADEYGMWAVYNPPKITTANQNIKDVDG